MLAMGVVPVSACSAREAGPVGGGVPTDGGNALPPTCDLPGAGPGLDYCLTEKREIRVPGLVQLERDSVVLVNVDDGTAAIIARDAGGFYALSGICTHQCCLVTLCASDDCKRLETNPGNCAVTPVAPLIGGARPAFLCPCHGSAFAADGTPLSGPAKAPLPAVALRWDGDDLIVDLSTSVSPATRVPASI